MIEHKRCIVANLSTRTIPTRVRVGVVSCGETGSSCNESLHISVMVPLRNILLGSAYLVTCQRDEPLRVPMQGCFFLLSKYGLYPAATCRPDIIRHLEVARRYDMLDDYDDRQCKYQNTKQITRNSVKTIGRTYLKQNEQ
jgi:hypothetical protein